MGQCLLQHLLSQQWCLHLHLDKFLFLLPLLTEWLTCAPNLQKIKIICRRCMSNFSITSRPCQSSLTLKKLMKMWLSKNWQNTSQRLRTSQGKILQRSRWWAILAFSALRISWGSMEFWTRSARSSSPPLLRSSLVSKREWLIHSWRISTMAMALSLRRPILISLSASYPPR